MSKRVATEIRLAAIAGIKPALLVCISILMLLPIRALVNLLFYRQTMMDWSLGFILAACFGLLWYLASFSSVLFDLRRGDARDAARNPSFPAKSFVTGVYSSGVMISIALMWGLHHQHESNILVFGSLIFAAISFYGWPRTIHCTADAVTQRSRLGRLRRISYNDVISIGVDNDGTTTVLGSKETIQHTTDHADAGYFASIVSKRSGKLY